MSYLQFRYSNYKFRPTWLGTLITVCCIPLFIKLGFWQYHKAEQKQALQTLYDSYMHSPPVALPTNIAEPESWRYRMVKVAGTYEPRYQIFLDNQVDQGRAGYHVITPLKIQATQHYVLVDRGWLPAEADHRLLPRIETPVGIQEIHGQVWLPPSRFYSLAAPADEDAAKSGWQALWQNMDMQRYAKTVPFQVLPIVIRLDAASQAGGFTRNWQRPAERVSTNIGYAYQWFGFAAAAFFIYIFVSMKKVRT
ncbi:MAG TPA: SURF1 family protein [Methylophilaceae bacterium]|nr:SURF1 family protein [Methylophilaceae bacterium]